MNYPTSKPHINNSMSQKCSNCKRSSLTRLLSIRRVYIVPEPTSDKPVWLEKAQIRLITLLSVQSEAFLRTPTHLDRSEVSRDILGGKFGTIRITVYCRLRQGK